MEDNFYPNEIEAIQAEINEHQKSINVLKDKMEDLLRAKLDVLIKQSKNGKVNILDGTYLFYNNRGELYYYEGKYGIASKVDYLTRMLEGIAPYSVMRKISNVKL